LHQEKQFTVILQTNTTITVSVFSKIGGGSFALTTLKQQGVAYVGTACRGTGVGFQRGPTS